MLDAKVWSRPEVPTRLMGAATTEATAAWCGGWADGLLTVCPELDRLRGIVDAFHRNGGANKPVHPKVDLSWAPTCDETHRQRRFNAVGSGVNWDIRMPEDFERATRFVRREDMGRTVYGGERPGPACGPARRAGRNRRGIGLPAQCRPQPGRLHRHGGGLAAAGAALIRAGGAAAADDAIGAVLCDMDGLLIDSERLSMQALQQAGLALGAAFPDPFCRSMIGNPMDRCAAMIREREGPAFPAERLLREYDAILAAMVENGELRTRPGADALLRTLDRLRLPRAVVTSSSRSRATHHLGRAGLFHRFDLLVTRDEVACGKPDPEPYRLAAALLGVAPGRCLALEDSYNGVRSAHAAGVPVVMVPDLLPPTAEMRERCSHVLPDLGAVAALIERRVAAAAGALTR